MKRRDNPNQTLINWSNPKAAVVAPAACIPDPIKLAAQAPPTLVERLPWDFTTTLPEPTDDAIDAGVVDETDLEPGNLRSLHENYTRECLAKLQQLDRVMDARRRGVDPDTGKEPRTHEARERLRKYFSEEPGRLEHALNVLVETYENAFGPAAAHAFNRFIRARHAGIPVEIDHSSISQSGGTTTPSEEPAARKRAKPHSPGSSSLPVPRPLLEAIKAGHFGLEAVGTPVNPTPDEVRAITEQHAEKIISLLEGRRQMERSFTAPQCGDRSRVGSEAERLKHQIQAEIDRYAASFGRPAAKQLERHCRRQGPTNRGQSLNR